MRKGAGRRNLHWLLWGTLTMLIVAAEGALIIQNGRRKRCAHILRTRAIAAQGCRASTDIAAWDGEQGNQEVP
jgi:hypothetical protein